MPKAIPMPAASSDSSSTPLAAPSSRLSATLRITGTILAEEDLEVAATVHGAISAPAHCVVVSRDATLEADILARDLTIHGRVAGKLTGTEIVDVQPGAYVRGTIASPRIVLDPDARVEGRVETRPVDAAVRVASYRRRQ